MRSCDDCGLPAYHPERVTTWEPQPRKVHGWVGNSWVPWEHKFKRPLERHRTLCGICAATHYGEADETRSERENPLTESEFWQHLADQATMENGARMDALDAQTRASPPEQCPTCLHYITDANRAKHDQCKARHERVQNESAAAPSQNNGAAPRQVNRGEASVSRRSGKHKPLPCGCERFTDIKTFAGWRDDGYRVPKGARRAWPVGAPVFCRHSIEPIPNPRVAA
mgnify:CR=1 FL=1|jgi:hypothetical protein